MDWFQDSLSKPLKPQHCPVCKAVIDKRAIAEPCIAHCDECMATFFYNAKETMPYKVEMDSKKRKQCGCDGCRARGR